MKKRILTLALALLLALSLLPAGALAAGERYEIYPGFNCGTGEVEAQYQRELQLTEAVERMGETALVDKVEHYVNDQLAGKIQYGYDDGRIAHKGTFICVEDNLLTEVDYMSFYYDKDGNQIDLYTKEVIGTYREFLDVEFPISHFFGGENTFDNDGNLVECRYTDAEGNAVRDVYSYLEPPAPMTPYADVPVDSYYFDAVFWAVDREITNGIDASHFMPNAQCTRAQMVTFLWRAAGEPAADSKENPFSDVKEDTYYYEAVLWAVENGITQGTGKGTFTPNAVVTRGQTVTFLYRFCEEPEVQKHDAGFDDVSAKAYYAVPVAWALENEITNGMGHNLFKPNDPCTRGQIVTFLYRAMALT